MSNQLELYKAKVWSILPKAPPPLSNRLSASDAVKLGLNRIERKLVSKNSSYRYGTNVFYPNSNIDIGKNFAVQTPIGSLTMKGFTFLNKVLSGKDTPFFNYLFDEVIGRAPGGNIITNLIKYTKFGQAILNSTPAPLQIRNGDMLYKYEMVSAKRGGILEFEYIEYLMLVDPYRKNRDNSSWVLYEQRFPLKIVEVPFSFKSPLSIKNKGNKDSDTLENASWLKRK